LIKNPKKIVVIRTAENFGDENTTFDKEFNGKFETHQYEFGLAVGILNPSCSHVWSTVMKNDICFPVFDGASNEITTLGGGYIGSKGNDMRDRLDWNKINTC
jgi:hypothetical protein